MPGLLRDLQESAVSVPVKPCMITELISPPPGGVAEATVILPMTEPGTLGTPGLG